MPQLSELDNPQPSLGQLIVDKVNSDYPGYTMTPQTDSNGCKHIILREVFRLGKPLPETAANSAKPTNPFGGANNMRTKINNILDNETHPDYPACAEIRKLWGGDGYLTNMISLDDAMPAIITWLGKVSPVHKNIKCLCDFIKANTATTDNEDDNDDDTEDPVNSLSAKFAELRPGCRVRTTNEKPQRVYAIDLVVVVAGQSRNTALQTVQAKIPNCQTAQ